MYTEYQVKGISDIIQQKICNNIHSQDRIVVSANCVLNKLIYEIDTDLCSFELIIELVGNNINFRLGQNINSKQNSDLSSFANEISNFSRKLELEKDLIKAHFIVLKNNS